MIAAVRAQRRAQRRSATCRRTRNESSVLRAMRAEARLGGGQDRIDQQHARGKLTARERLDLLLDAGSFVELDAFVTHRSRRRRTRARPWRRRRHRPRHDRRSAVFVFSQDFTVFGGSLSEAYAEKICKVMDLAMKVGAPIVGLNDSGGARIQEGVVSLGGYADIFLRNTLASGVVPQTVPGPRPVRRWRGVLAGDHRLHGHGRGDELHVRHRAQRREGRHPRGRRRGALGRRDDPHDASAASRISPRRDEAEALTSARRILGYLPQNNLADAPRRETSRSGGPVGCRARRDRPRRSVEAVRHARRHRAHRRRRDVPRDPAGLGAEHHRRVCAARRPQRRDRRAAAGGPRGRARHRRIDKAARFVRTCDCFNVPLLTFVDVPGFLPGVGQEHGGIIRHGAKLLYAYCEATVPKLTVITRKAYGGAYDVMSSKHVRGDINLAWPTAEIAVMGAEGAVNIISPRSRSPRPPTRRRSGRSWSPTTRSDSPTRTSRPRAATSTTSSCRPRRGRASSRRSRCSPTSGTRTRRRSTATSRCDERHRPGAASLRKDGRRPPTAVRPGPRRQPR